MALAFYRYLTIYGSKFVSFKVHKRAGMCLVLSLDARLSGARITFSNTYMNNLMNSSGKLTDIFP